MPGKGARGVVARLVGASVAVATLSGAAVGVLGSTPAGAAATPTLVTSPTAVPQSMQCPAGVGTGSPGVSAKSITVAAISTQSGPIAADFAAFVPGVEAYFDYIDHKGGVNGRKINLAYNLDDTGTHDHFVAETNTAIHQDHAFAVFASSYFFTPQTFVQNCTPTYGYNVSGNWATSPNLFAAGGSTQTYHTIVPAIAYLFHKLKAKSFATLSYNVSTSAAACTTTMTEFHQNGLNVGYSDLKITFGNPNVTPDVQRMKAAGTDFILSCMTINGNIDLARAAKQYGLHATMLFLTTGDQTAINKDSTLLQGAYFNYENVPFLAPQSTYPGLKTYLTAMRRYEPNDVYDDLSVQGWESASLLVAGIKAAGKNPTQAAVVKATNAFTQFTAGGLIVPENWTYTHTKVKPPYCNAFATVHGTKVVPAQGKGKQVFLCFDNTVKHPTPVAPKPGTPGT